VLPGSGSAQVGTPVTAFATIINTGPGAATGCSISPVTSIAADFLYQTTDPATNALTGTPNTPVDIAEGAAQSFILAFTPTAPFAPVDVELKFDCSNTTPAASSSGLNTLLLSASATAVPDIVALAVTPTGDGIVRMTTASPDAAFAVATVNVGNAGAPITASADTGSATLPVTLSVCETNPETGACVSPIAPEVTTNIDPGATPTFGVFLTASGSIPLDPATNRAFVRFRDDNGIVRGSSSVALSSEFEMPEPPPPERRFGVIGDSIAAATHTDDMCGSGDELMNCLRKKLDEQDPAWSYASGDKAWSLGRQAGFDASAIISAADDGAEWKDALDQAQDLFEQETGLGQLTQVFIGLGSNDVCAEFGHLYDGDLQLIAQHMDNTLTYLTDTMAGRADAVVFISSTPDILAFRDLMVNRQHNIAFKTCQAVWDVDVNELQAEARDSLCRGELDRACEVLPSDLQEELIDLFVNALLDRNDVDEGPCGRVLSSANTEQQRLEARDYNIALNQLMADKSADYDGRNGVRVRFSDALFDSVLEPYMISQLDCYHPSRAGQMAVAQTIWQGFAPAQPRTDRYYYDAFENTDVCVQEFTEWAGQCWVEGGSPVGFDTWIGSDGWFRLLKDTDNNVSHWVERTVGDLSEKTAAWLSFRHRRTRMDDDGDRVDFLVYDADGSDSRPPGWVQLDVFRGPGVDVGVHSGEYYDLTPYLSADLRIRFLTNNARSMENGDGLKWDEFSLFAW
jgi:lysophospholipase L1-like esterase